MVNAWEYSYNGLTFGGAQNIGVISVAGLDDSPDYREDITPRMGAHGGYAFAQFLDVRRMIFEGDIVDPNMFTLLNTLKMAFVPQIADLPMVFQRPSLVQQRVYCKPSRINVPTDQDFQIGNGKWHLELIAGDPFIYEDTQRVVTILPAATASALNVGIIETVFDRGTITGPGTTFTIKDNVNPSKALKINTTITGSQTISVDFKNRTVIRNDGTNLYSSLDSTSAWWTLVPGTTTVAFTVASGTSGGTKLDLGWRGAWI